ncbi:hypothetical protein VP01_7698g1, partial [Puccinia sorghi]
GKPLASPRGGYRIITNTYTDNYKKVHTKSIATGFGLNNEDQKSGISKFNEMLERLCPHCHAMKKLMHKLTKKMETSSPCEPSGNEIR